MTSYVTGAPGATGAVPAPEPAAAQAAAGRAARKARAALPGSPGRAGAQGRAEWALKVRRPGWGNGTRAAADDVQPAGAPDAAVSIVGPRADCTADAAGGLTFDVRTAGEAVRPPADAALLLRLRDGDGGPADTVRLPLGATEAEGVLRAVLPSIMSLPEGRWDAYAACPGREPLRLLPGVHDLRSLIGRVPRAGRTWLGVRIPYATKFGNLTIRSWLRWPHAEAGALCVVDGVVVLSGRLYGARLSPAARLEAHPREPAGAPVNVPLLLGGEEAAGRDGDGAARCGTGGAGTDDGRTGAGSPTGAEPAPVFTARLPLGALPSGDRVWDLWLRPSADEEPVRIARILDDVPDKKHIFSYPPQRVVGEDGAARTVRPYYTLDNDLSVRVSCGESV